MIESSYLWFILCRGMKVFWKSQIELQIEMLREQTGFWYYGEIEYWLLCCKAEHKVGSVEFGRN